MHGKRAVLGMVPVTFSALLAFGCGGSVANQTLAPAVDAGGVDSGEPDGSHNPPPTPVPDAAPNEDVAPPPVDASHPWSPVCPEQPPSLGTSCAPEGTQCEYGTQYDPSCNDLVQCQGGAWTQTRFGPCNPTSDPNPPACPATSADVPKNQACSDTGLVCLYADQYCSCNFTFGPPPPTRGSPRRGAAIHPPGARCPGPASDRRARPRTRAASTSTATLTKAVRAECGSASRSPAERATKAAADRNRGATREGRGDSLAGRGAVA